MKSGALRFEKFGLIDAVSDYPQGHACFMDYDKDTLLPTIPQLYSLFRVLGLRPIAVVYKKSKRGWHIVAVFPEKYKPMELVAIQAICGSDPMREALNWVRASQPGQLRGFWGRRWNILYSKKI